MRYFLFILFFFTTLNADVLLNKSVVNIKDFNLEYYVDNSHKMYFDKVIQQEFTKAINKKTFPAHITNLWLKFDIYNNTSTDKKIYIVDTPAFMNQNIQYIKTSLDDRILEKKEIDFNIKKGFDMVLGANTLYPTTIASKTHQRIYINIKSYIYQDYEILILDDKSLVQMTTKESIYILLIIGILMGIMIYNFVLYLNTPFNEYLYYTLYIFFAMVWVAFQYGFLDLYFEIYGKKAFRFNFSIVISGIFFLAFIKSILETSKYYPIENKILNINILLSTSILAYAYIDMINAFKIYDIVLVISFLIFLSVSISLYIKKNPYIKYLLFAQFWLIFFSLIGILFYEGLIAYSQFAKYSASIGITIEAILLSYILSYKIKIIDKENKKNINIATQYEDRLSALNELLDNIAHQWRQPLANINSAVMDIDIEIRGAKVSIDIIDKKLDEIENLSIYLSQTIDDFKNIYEKNQKKEQFYLYHLVSKSLHTISSKFNNIDIYIEIDKKVLMYGYPTHLKQVLFVLFNNSQDAFISTQNPEIHISLQKKESRYILIFEDNGEGIEEEHREKIFLQRFSTKKNGSGIGLYMSQKILKQFMNASLYLEPHPYKTIFCIEFDKKEKNENR